MYRLVEFIRRSYVTILFVVLEIVAVSIYMRSTPYTRARILSKVYAVTGGVATLRSNIVSYFSLAKENRLLTERIAQLERETVALREAVIDSELSDEDFDFDFIPAQLVANTVNRTYNYMMLNKGAADGVTPESAVVTAAGAVVGYILECSDHYASAVSILNPSFRTSGRIEGSEYSGSIEWRGGSPYEVTLCEVSKYAELEIGQQVVTTGFSHYFAPGMPIGTISGFELDETRTYYTANVRLAADMSRLQNVLIIKNEDIDEMKSLDDVGEYGFFN